MPMNFWPFTRLRTYSPGTPVYSNDLNALQDAIVRARHGPITVPIPLTSAVDIAGWTHTADGLVAPADGGVAVFTLPFAANTVIVDITAWWNLQGHPLQYYGADDVLLMTVAKRDPFADETAFERLSEQIADTTIGEHDDERVRYRWQLEPGPVHLQPGYLYRLSVSLGQGARRLDGIAATIARA